jgi:hypothetical protein
LPWPGHGFDGRHLTAQTVSECPPRCETKGAKDQP